MSYVDPVLGRTRLGKLNLVSANDLRVEGV